MRLILGSPALHCFPFFILDGKFCPRQFLSGYVRLGNLCFCHVVLHLHFLHFACILHSKYNALCGHIAVCRLCFGHRIFPADRQFFDNVRLFAGNPFIYKIAILIRHLQLCALNLFAIRKGCFGKLKYRRHIFKGKFIGDAFFFRILIGKLKFLHLALTGKSRSRGSFFHIIRKSNRKVSRKDKFSIFVRGFFLDHRICLHNHIAVFVGNVLFCA